MVALATPQVLLVASSRPVSPLAASLVTPWNCHSHAWQCKLPVEEWPGGQRSGMGLSYVPLPASGAGDKASCAAAAGDWCLWMCHVGVPVSISLSLLCVLQPHSGCQDHANIHT